MAEKEEKVYTPPMLCDPITGLTIHMSSEDSWRTDLLGESPSDLEETETITLGTDQEENAESDKAWNPKDKEWVDAHKGEPP